MAMKKFINSAETVTDEELVGLGLAFGDTVIVVTSSSAVVRQLNDIFE